MVFKVYLSTENICLGEVHFPLSGLDLSAEEIDVTMDMSPPQLSIAQVRGSVKRYDNFANKSVTMLFLE